ncbi:MAG: DUF1559 domain-containing protein [Planctomycetes bacterium]|nr:DUF1559 domain-containing protein [Planctomycetota bacterium]
MERQNFTLLEAIVVVFVVLILFFIVIPIVMAHPRIKSVGPIWCLNNLRQIGQALSRYELAYQSAPAYSAASAATTTDGKLCAANLMRLYSSGFNDYLGGFSCPLDPFLPAREDAAARPEAVRDDPNGAKYTSYNLTTCYDRGDPANKIVVADMPFTKDNVAASVHDEQPDKMDLGPNCLYKDGHASRPPHGWHKAKIISWLGGDPFRHVLCPYDSSEYDLSPQGNIYRVDGGGGKGKDTCILGVER